VSGAGEQEERSAGEDQNYFYIFAIYFVDISGAGPIIGCMSYVRSTLSSLGVYP
jgi:hypothetical protein